MATSVSYAELQKMTEKDLQSEIRENELALQKMRMDITMGRDKDTARYQRLKKGVARMKTALTAKTREEALKAPAKAPTLSAPVEKKVTAKKAPSKATSRKASSSKS